MGLDFSPALDSQTAVGLLLFLFANGFYFFYYRTQDPFWISDQLIYKSSPTLAMYNIARLRIHNVCCLKIGHALSTEWGHRLVIQLQNTNQKNKKIKIIHSNMHLRQLHHFSIMSSILPFCQYLCYFQMEKTRDKAKIFGENFKHIKVRQFKAMTAKRTLIEPSAHALLGKHIRTIYCKGLPYTDTKQLLPFLTENVFLYLQICWLSLFFV